MIHDRINTAAKPTVFSAETTAFNRFANHLIYGCQGGCSSQTSMFDVRHVWERLCLTFGHGNIAVVESMVHFEGRRLSFTNRLV